MRCRINGQICCYYLFTENIILLDQRVILLEEIVAQIRIALDAEYKRGTADSLKNLAQMLDDQSPIGRLSSLATGRVPKGSAKAFVERALTSTPMSIAELRSSSKTDVEKRLSYQTVRLELERGRKAKKYKKMPGGKWARC
jgi:hypothetical protein